MEEFRVTIPKHYQIMLRCQKRLEQRPSFLGQAGSALLLLSWAFLTLLDVSTAIAAPLDWNGDGISDPTVVKATAGH